MRLASFAVLPRRRRRSVADAIFIPGIMRDGDGDVRFGDREGDERGVDEAF